MLRNTIPTTIYDLLPAINVGAFLRLIFHRRLLERHAERHTTIRQKKFVLNCGSCKANTWWILKKR
jgi:hypothetical protein